MEGKYEATKGAYRETVKQITTITEVRAPTIAGAEDYTATHAVEYETKDNVLVNGQNGSLSIGVKRGKFGFIERVKQAYSLIRNNGVKVHGGAPSQDAIAENPVVQQYLADSAAFRDVIAQKKGAVAVLSDRRVQVDANGTTEIPLEKRL
jgi:hypothetical protein